jgi:hypothetical protein
MKVWAWRMRRHGARRGEHFLRNISSGMQPSYYYYI